MSDLLNQASLVMVPSGYKEDTVYSVVPSDGNGDLTFTRASNGTRINSAGLVEVVPWNLLQYSETFNTSWTASNVTITANDTTAPNGTTTAEKALCASGSSISPNIFYSGSLPCISGQVYTYSYYAKKGTTNFAKIRFSGTAFASVTNTPIFNLNTGVVVSGTGTIQDVGNGWYRISATATAETSASGVVTVDIPSSTGVWPNGNFAGTEYIYIWGAQLNIGSTAKPYFPTTDRLNVPRLTYQNGGGGCPSLLLEKQSTNLITNSEDFTQTSWTKYQATITGNNTTSPDGTQNADKFVDNTNNDIHAVYLGITISSDTTISIYVKSAEYTRFAIANLSDGGDVIFNLSTVAVVSASANFKNNKIESVGNGWYRVSATTNGTSGGKAMGFMLVNDSNQLSFVGTGSNGVYIWGAQYETSSYSTSYIPTTSSSATRVADACYKTGISSLIGQTEGVFYAEFTIPETESPSFFSISDGTSANRIIFGYYLGNLRYYTNSSSGGFSAIGVIDSSPVVGQVYKIAIAYKSNDFVVYKNGTNTNTLTTYTVPTSLTQMDNAGAGASQNIYASVKEILLFKTRLTNAELASLTTL